MATCNTGTTHPATKQADETIHHLMEDIGDFVVCRTNNSSLVCTIYTFISKQDTGKGRTTTALHVPHVPRHRMDPDSCHVQIMTKREKETNMFNVMLALPLNYYFLFNDFKIQPRFSPRLVKHGCLSLTHTHTPPTLLGKISKCNKR